MAFYQGWKQVLQADSTDETFLTEGSEILALSNHAGGSWNLDMIMPDDSIIRLRVFSSNDTQLILAPRGTKIRLYGGAQGATAWTGIYDPTPAGRLL